jgi:hypothetical protein
LLLDTALTGFWPTTEDWTLLEYVLNQNVLSLFQNTKRLPVESHKSLSVFIDSVFNFDDTWEQVFEFKWTPSWQNDFLTFQLFFQFITLIRQTGVEGNHRQEVTNRVLFGFDPTGPFPFKKSLQTEGWKAYDMAVDSTVNKAVKLSIIIGRDNQITTDNETSNAGKQNFIFNLVFVSYLIIRSLTNSLSLPASITTDNDNITTSELEKLRSISEAITESRDLHITNDWSHIINQVINGYTNQKEFQLVSEHNFVYKEELKTNIKCTVENDNCLRAQRHLHLLITEVLFKTHPGKEAVVRHGHAKNHVVTQEGWNETCLKQSAWISYNSSPHPVVSCLTPRGVMFNPN